LIVSVEVLRSLQKRDWGRRGIGNSCVAPTALRILFANLPKPSGMG
jgi:hypothetical protein